MRERKKWRCSSMKLNSKTKFTFAAEADSQNKFSAFKFIILRFSLSQRNNHFVRLGSQWSEWSESCWQFSGVNVIKVSARSCRTVRELCSCTIVLSTIYRLPRRCQWLLRVVPEPLNCHLAHFPAAQPPLRTRLVFLPFRQFQKNICVPVTLSSTCSIWMYQRNLLIQLSPVLIIFS